MVWKIIIVLTAAVAAYFIPTPKQLQETFNGAQNLLASSNYKKAIEQYELIINTESDLLEEDSVHVTILSGDLTIGVVPASYYQKANALRQLKHLDSAITVFRIVENRDDEPVLAALSQFQIYDIYYGLAKFEDAIREARKLVTKYPKHTKAEAALYDIAWAQRELSDLTKSNEALIELIERYPKTEFLSKALYQLGQNCFELREFDKAIVYWNDLTVRFKPEAFKQQDWEKVQLKSVRERQIFDATSKRETESSSLELVAKSQVKIGDCYREKSSYDSAMIAYRKVVTAYTLLPVLVEVTYIKMAEYARQAKGIAEGERMYREAIDASFPDKELQAKFQYKIAEMYQNDNRNIKAADEYEFYAKAYGEVAQNINFPVEDALYTRAICLYNGDQYERTVSAIDSFMTVFSTSNYIEDLFYLKGVSQFRLRALEGASETFRVYLEKYPSNNFLVPANIYIGRVMLELKKESEAAPHFGRLLREYPSAKQKDELNYYFIQACYELKQYDSVIAAFTGINPFSPYYPAVIIKAAKSYTLQKKYSEGESFCKRIVALADSIKDSVYFRPEANFAIADLYIAMSKFEEAIKYLGVVVEDKKTTELLRLQSTFLRGTLYGQVNKNKESISDLEFVLNDAVFLEKFKPLLANARGRLATAYTKTGQVQKGTDLMMKYVNESADSTEKMRYLVALCEVYFDLKNFDKLVSAGESALAMNSDDEFLHSRTAFLTATAYNAKNQFPKALRVLEHAAERFPDINQDIFFNFAVSLYDMSYYKNAAEAFAKYIERYPKSANVKNSMFFIGYAYYKLGEWDLAVEGFKNFIKLFPQDSYAPEAQYNIAEARYNQGKFPEAIIEYKEAYTLYPKSDFAPNAVYNEAWSNYQLKDVDKMIIPLQKLIKEYPKHALVAEAQYTLGDYFYNKKDYTKALTEYRTFIERFPEHSRTEEARSFIQELSQIDAFKAYQKAIVFFDKQNWQQAIVELGKIVASYPETEIAIACEANIASAYSQVKNTAKAYELFKAIVTKYKDNPLASGVVYFAQQHIEWIEGNATASK